MELRIPQNCWPFLLLQRTGLCARGKAIDKEISTLIEADIASFRDWLPDAPSKILDIGCGLALIDVALHSHYNCDKRINYYLCDETRLDKLRYGYASDLCFYNSLDYATQLLIDHGLAAEQLNIVRATAKAVSQLANIGLLISLKSWGFHYPLDVYLDEVHRVMAIGAVAIVDVRHRTPGKELLKQRFGNVEVAKCMQSSDRCVVRKATS